MKTYIYFLFISIFALASTAIAGNTLPTLPAIPQHPSIAGFHDLPVTIEKGAVRALSLESKQQLDSIVTVGKEKIVYDYNNKEQNSLLTVYTWSTARWKPTFQVGFIYNDLGQITENSNYTWNESASKWESAWKTIYTYNNHGQFLTEQYVTYNVYKQKWENHQKYSYTYTNNGVITKRTYADWNAATATWMVNWITDYVYNVKKQLVAETSYLSGYVPATKIEFAYNATGGLVSRTNYYSNTVTNRWEASYKEEFMLDNLQRPVVQTYRQWNSTSGTWTNISKKNLNLDSNGNTLSLVDYRWNTIASKWDYSQKEEGTFDANNNFKKIVYSSWNEALNNWDIQSEHTCSYNDDVLVSSLVLPTFYQSPDKGNRQIIAQTNQYTKDNAWLDRETLQFYYSPSGTTTQVVEQIENDVAVYVDANSDMLTIDLPSDTENAIVALYDTKGSVVYNGRIESNENISVATLPNGIYMYQVAFNAQQRHGKVLLKR